MTDQEDNPVRVTVSGSFIKHWDEIGSAIAMFRSQRATVLSPVNGPPMREESGFVYLRDDVGTADEVEHRHLEAIRRSDLLYVVNPGGYLGHSVAMELGYAMAWRVPIWSAEAFRESPHRLLVRVGSPAESLGQVAKARSGTQLPVSGQLDELQAYVQRASAERGFADEKPGEVMILLVEEIGELAKAVRAYLHLAMSDGDKSTKSVRLELADCLIYLLHMANQVGVNLLSAFRDKEKINWLKTWSKG